MSKKKKLKKTINAIVSHSLERMKKLKPAERFELFMEVGEWIFNDFDPRELALVEVLRTLRIIHHSAWIGRRWSDPAFPRAFPWFNSARYWSDQILTLREQFSALDEPPLEISP